MSLTMTLTRGGGKIEGSGTDFTLEGTAEGLSVESVEMYGDTEQAASPTPDSPQEVQTVTGRQVVTISDGGSQSQEYEVNLGKNLFDKDNANTIVAYIQWTTPRVLNYSSGNSSVYIPCQPNTTYTISKVADNVFRAGSIEEEPTTGITVYNAEDNPTGTSITITTSSKAKYIVVFLRNNSSTNSLETILASLQIERGSTATTYASYFTPIELCKIGDYQDYIYSVNGEWYLHKEVGKVVLNGTENWTQTGGGVPYTDSITDYALASNIPISDYFTGEINHDQATELSTNRVGFNKATNTIRFWVKYLDKFASGSDVATWLTTHPTKVYYALRTPTDTQITNSALIAQLEALNEATTYDGQTEVSVSSQNLPAWLDMVVDSDISKTYTEIELGVPLTIADVEGKSQTTTLDGNVYVDWAYNKKSFSVDIFNLTPKDYADIRAFYDYQFTAGKFPTLSIPELDILNMPVFFEMSSRNIVNQCLLTDKLTLKFRETVQP